MIVLRLCMVKLDAAIATAPPWMPDREPTIELPFDNVASEPIVSCIASPSQCLATDDHRSMI
eukprot:894452-Prymnesium_polylepis.1